MNLKGYDAQLAEELSMSTRNLYKVRRAAKFDLYASQWRAIEQAMTAMDERYGLA